MRRQCRAEADGLQQTTQGASLACVPRGRLPPARWKPAPPAPSCRGSRREWRRLGCGNVGAQPASSRRARQPFGPETASVLKNNGASTASSKHAHTRKAISTWPGRRSAGVAGGNAPAAPVRRRPKARPAQAGVDQREARQVGLVTRARSTGGGRGRSWSMARVAPRGKPSRRVGGLAVARPGLHGLHAGLLHGVLGQREVRQAVPCQQRRSWRRSPDELATVRPSLGSHTGSTRRTSTHRRARHGAGTHEPAFGRRVVPLLPTR